MPARVYLRGGRERSVERGHPWVLSGSVERVEGEPDRGAIVAVVGANGEVLGFGDYDPDSQIRVRLWGREKPEIGEVERRARAAVERRQLPELADTNAVRLVHAEADGLPGMTVDRYADVLCVVLSTPGMRRRAGEIADALAHTTGAKGAWLRGQRRGEAPRTLFGEVPEGHTTIAERARTYTLDVRTGQKTGFYLDQRNARDRFQRLAAGRRALDLFAYTGGFSAAALSGGAREVVAVESSAAAAELAATNAPGAERVVGDVQAFLRAGDDLFDLISLDPPPFAKRKRDTQPAARAYKDLHLQALRRAAPGADLLTFTCSHHISADLFRKIVFGAALDAGREVQVMAPLAAPPDHPISIYHPEGEYLSGLWLRVGGDR